MGFFERFLRLVRGHAGNRVSVVTIGSLCTGYGGLDLAVEEFTGGRTIWTSDIDKHASLIIDSRMPHAPNLGDLKKIDWHNVPRVDWLTAGYPCQPFSNAGLRKGIEDERHIWPWIAEGIGIIRPGYVLLENVSAHIKRGLDTVLGDLDGLGFDAQWCSIRASDVGAPHQRKRVFILATYTNSQRSQGSSGS